MPAPSHHMIRKFRRKNVANFSVKENLNRLLSKICFTCAKIAVCFWLFLLSLPAWGAWIEIKMVEARGVEPLVAPRMGSVN